MAITYARVDGPPQNWMKLRIVNADTGIVLQKVIEVDAINGWAKIYKVGEDGLAIRTAKGDEYEIETVFGQFRIEELDE